MAEAMTRAARREVVFTRGVYVAALVLIAGWIVYQLRAVLTPLFLAFAIAYVLDPLVDLLERLKLPRAVAIVLVMVTSLALVVGSLVLVVPGLVAEVAGVVRELPKHASAALAKLEPWLLQYDIHLPHTTREWMDQLEGKADVAAGTVLGSIGGALGWLVGGTVSVVGAVVAALIVPVFAVYLLYDFDRLMAGTRDLIPLRHRAKVVAYAKEIDHVLGRFLRGQLIVMVILAVLYGGAYSALGVRLAIPIGIVAGMLNFIPYLGSAFALIAGLLMCAIGGGGLGQLIGVVAAYAVVQSLEGFVITPRVVGQTVGLRDVWVLLALFVGGEIFGFLGVLLALPLAAVAKVFIVHAVAHYRTTDMFSSPAPALPENPAAPEASD